VKILEVVSGLKLGGSEIFLSKRIIHAEQFVHTGVLNSNKKIKEVILPSYVEYFESPKNLIWFGIKVMKVIRDFDPEIIIVRTPVHAILFTTVYRRMVQEIKLVYEVGSEITSESKYKSILLDFIVPRINPKINLHIACSNKTAKSVVCKNASKIEVVYFGAEVNLKAIPTCQNNDGPVFLILGRLVPIKQPILIFQAVCALQSDFRRMSAKVIFIGDGPLLAKLQDLIVENHLDDFIQANGRLDDPNPILASSDVLINFSRSEGLPLSFYEAKQHGLRVLTSPSGGTSEITDELDVITKTFTDSELKNQLKYQLLIGKVDSKQRELQKEINSKFALSNTSKDYYEILRNTF
jgi:glycosyltransferase involved in cell wall biosynthesis